MICPRGAGAISLLPPVNGLCPAGGAIRPAGGLMGLAGRITGLPFPGAFGLERVCTGRRLRLAPLWKTDVAGFLVNGRDCLNFAVRRFLSLWGGNLDEGTALPDMRKLPLAGRIAGLRGLIRRILSRVKTRFLTVWGSRFTMRGEAVVKLRRLTMVVPPATYTFR